MVDFIGMGFIWAIIFIILMKWNPGGIKEKVINWIEEGWS